MKFVLFGEDVFTATVLQAMLDQQKEVLLVVCPFYQNNNHTRLQRIAEQNNIEFIREQNVNSGSVKERLLKIEPDLIISVHLRKILSKEIFSIAKKGAMNVHPSLLPKYRGLSPQHQAIIHGDSESGVTVHSIDESVDTGNIIIQETIAIENDDYISDFQFKMLEVYKRIVVRAIERISDKNFIPVKQQKENTSYFGSLKKKDREIDFFKTKADALNLIRAVSYPYKGACSGNYTIWRAAIPNETVEGKYLKSYPEPGIYAIEEELVLLRFNDGVLLSDDFETIENDN